MSNRSRGVLFGVTIALLLHVAFGVPSSAHACTGTQPITSCTQTCTANCFLNAEISCGAYQGITLNAGYNLDMCGHDITCTSGTCFANSAITMAGNSSKVFNSLATGPYADPSKISGLFISGVDCDLKTGSQVIGIRVENAAYGVIDCAKVENNTFFNNNAGVISSGVANTDVISDNYFETTGRGVDFNGTESIEISHNVFNATEGIYLSSTGAVDVLSNVIFGASSTPITDNGYSNFVSNVCDPSNTSTYGCGYCQSQGWCQGTGAPYSGL